jgi:hypothetical protein
MSTITVHPLAISSICDHYTRVKLGGSLLPKESQVIGLVFGTRSGGKFIIFDAVEVSFTESQGRVVFPAEHVRES